MSALQLRNWIIPGLLVTSILLGIGLFLGQGYLRSERAAYERGAAIAVLHVRCRGAFPSAAYLARTFPLSDPQTCADLDRMDQPSGHQSPAR